MTEEDVYDVVIIGAGPAGLVAAAWMARTNVKTLVVDKDSHPPLRGHADGIESRTFEILDTFGVGDKIWREANRAIEVSLWVASQDAAIRRVHSGPNAQQGLSDYGEATLSQGRIQQLLLDFVKASKNVTVHYETLPRSLELERDRGGTTTEHPIRLELTAHARHNYPALDPHKECTCSDRPSRKIRAKYVIGCDGAHSWVRKCLGLELRGESASEHWGVIDCVSITNFPDIRKRCIVQTARGTLMTIPRERNLIRIYVQLARSVPPGLSELQLGDIMLHSAARIYEPYLFRARVIEWTSQYSVKQTMCDTYAVDNRIFLAGDAVHTHSPKAGQGMNVSMQDTYNLGWKMASVVHGVSPPHILATYQQERLPVAERLLMFDRDIYQAMCPKDRLFRPDDMLSVLRRENTSASGIAVTYKPNLVVSCDASRHQCALGNDHHQPRLATKIRIGAKLPGGHITNHSGARSRNILSILPQHGQWSLLVFGGRVGDQAQMARVNSLCFSLSQNLSCIRDEWTVRKVLIHTSSRHEVDFYRLPDMFAPFDPVVGYDYGRVFVDSPPHHHHGAGGFSHMYDDFGINRDYGCIVLLRPDQHVAFIGSLEDVKALKGFLSRIIRV